jgi:uncharacterized delta-60 repeat protein
LRIISFTISAFVVILSLMKKLIVLLVMGLNLLVIPSVYTNPVVTSINPNQGSVDGGNNISISGSGFVDSLASADLDPSFVVGSGAQNIVRAIAIANDGKVIIGGQFASYQGNNSRRIARLNPDGSYDSSFVVGNGFNGTVWTVAIQNDGKVIVGGEFNNYNSPNRSKIARLNADGSLDTTFDPLGGANNAVRSVAIQSDGKIVVVGEFTTFNSQSYPRIVRLNPDGSIDTSFVVGSGLGNSAWDVGIQNDGKIIVGGILTSYQGFTSNKIVRINTNGSYDGSFNIGNGFDGNVTSLEIMSSGKIVVGGYFGSFNGFGLNKIARLNADGSRDISFDALGSGPASNVEDVSVQTDGKIIAVGSFYNVNGNVSPNIVRLNLNGSYDSSFDVKTTPWNGGFDNTAFVTKIQSDGKILVGGRFTSYKGQSSLRLARLTGTGGNLNIKIGANDCLNITFISSTELSCIVPAGTVGFKNVTITNPNGQSTVVTNGYLYVDNNIKLSFSIRNETDTSNTNLCNFGTVTTGVVYNCKYRLKVNTNATNGYVVSVQTSGDLVGQSVSIANALSGVDGGTNIGPATVNDEYYGVRINAGQLSSLQPILINPLFTATTNFTKFNNTTQQYLIDASGANEPNAVDTVRTHLIEHRLTIAGDSSAGNYSQKITYTVVPRF